MTGAKSTDERAEIAQTQQPDRCRERQESLDGPGAGVVGKRCERPRQNPRPFGRAEDALADGFRPDTISTDLHRFNVPTPVVDLTTTMSKFLYLGLPLADVVAMTTMAPAAAIGYAGVRGSLAVGARADVTLLRLEEGSFLLEDSYGATVTARERLVAAATFVAGRRVA